MGQKIGEVRQLRTGQCLTSSQGEGVSRTVVSSMRTATG